MELASVQDNLALIISIALFAVKGFAFVDCVTRNDAQIGLHSQVSKTGWLVILGLALVVHLLQMYPLGLLNLIGTLAAFVYLAQVRGSLR